MAVLVATALERAPRRAHPQRVPRPVDGSPGLFTVDATWGTIAPMTLAPGVHTVGELEVLAHLGAGGALVDCRRREYLAGGTIPGAVAIPHDEVVARIGELDPERPTVMFCNGPQCTATPQAVAALLAAGYPAAGLLYYRGGIHDWVTLGLPLAHPARSTPARRRSSPPPDTNRTPGACTSDKTQERRSPRRDC